MVASILGRLQQQTGSQLRNRRDLASVRLVFPDSTRQRKHRTAMATAAAPPKTESSRRVGPILTAWVACLVAIHAADWLVGTRSTTLVRAVEQGEAKVEAQTLGADLSSDAARKLIQLQRDTRPFWATLALLGDFVIDPLALLVRPLLVATLFAAWAALAGRDNGFAPALVEGATLQGLWLVGPALALALTLSGFPSEPDTSLGLFLPPGPRSAWVYTTFHQADLFALWGWFALARSGWKRRQVSPILALATVIPLLVIEIALRSVGSAILGAGMRLTIIPE